MPVAFFAPRKNYKTYSYDEENVFEHGLHADVSGGLFAGRQG